MTEAEAAADFARQGQLLASAYPDENSDVALVVEKLTGVDADFRGGLAAFLTTFLGLGALVLIVASLNVASLMVTRALARRRELDVRFALGAPRARVARQLLVEAALVAVLAAALGVVLAREGVRLVSQVFSSVDSRVDLAVQLDMLAVGVTVVLAVLVTLVCGLVPGLAAARGGFGGLRSRGGGRRRWWRASVVTQVVLTVIVLIVAMLFVRALGRAGTIDPGFDPERVLAVSVDPRMTRMDDEAARALLEETLLRAEGLAGVEAAALATRLPLTLGARFFPNPLTLSIPGHQPPEDQEGFHIEHAIVSRDYFETMGIARVQGDGLTRVVGSTSALDNDLGDGPGDGDGDRGDRSGMASGSRGELVVNEQFVRRFFDGGDVLGRSVRAGDTELVIVGVVADSRVRTLDRPPEPMVYLSFEQRAP